MKITDYPQASVIKSDHRFLVDGPDGTQTVSGALILEHAGSGEPGGVGPDVNAYISHRNTYRGKNLGSTYTAEQKTAISSGTFDDIYVGDYWKQSDGTIWRVMDLDYFPVEEHHAVIMPDSPLSSDFSYHSSNDLASIGYIRASVRTNIIPTYVAPKVNAMFSDIINYEEKFVSGTQTSGDFNANRFETGTASIELPTTAMLFGDFRMGSNLVILNLTSCSTQLRAFFHNPKLIKTNYKCATRDVLTKNVVIVQENNHAANAVIESTKFAVRPVFGIK